MLQLSHVRAARCRQPRRETLQRSPQFKELKHILLAKGNYPSAAPGGLGDKTLVRQNVDRLSNGGLRRPEFPAPRALDNAHTWGDPSGDNLVAQAFGQGMLDQGPCPVGILIRFRHVSAVRRERTVNGLERQSVPPLSRALKLLVETKLRTCEPEAKMSVVSTFKCTHVGEWSG